MSKTRGLCSEFFALKEREIMLTYCLGGKIHSASLSPGKSEGVLTAIKEMEQEFESRGKVGEAEPICFYAARGNEGVRK